MNLKDKGISLFFQNIVKNLSNPGKSVFLIEALEMAPDYFWYAPASSTGKYHPSFAAQKGGLVLHTLTAIKIAKSLFPAYPELTLEDQENIIVALSLHDTVKKGFYEESNTVAGHERFPREYFISLKSSIPNDYEEIMDLISTHMGIWNEDGNPPKRKEGYRISPAEIVHLADLLSSRKSLEEIFAQNIYI